MNLRQIQIILIFVCVVEASVIHTEQNNRSKRTLHYFLDGLFSVLNHEKHKTQTTAASRVSNNQKGSISPLVTISRLSSISQPKKINDFNDSDADDDQENQILNTNRKPFAQVQVPIPNPVTSQVTSSTSDGPTKISLLTSTSAPTTTTFEDDDGSSTESVSNSDETTPNSDESNETSTIGSTEYETSIDESNESTSTIEPCLDTDSSAIDLTTPFGDGSDAKHNTINDDNGDDDEIFADRPVFRPGSIPSRAAHRYTTQYFGGPIIIERHHDAQHSPMYYEKCGKINCMDDGDNKNQVRPYILPMNIQRGALIVVPIGYAVPPQTSRKINPRSSESQSRVKMHDSEYELYTWHQNEQPVLHLHQPHIQFYGSRN